MVEAQNLIIYEAKMRALGIHETAAPTRLVREPK